MLRPVPAPAARPYEPPKIFRVRIAGDELAVSGCKTGTSGSGPNPPTCSKTLCKSSAS